MKEQERVIIRPAWGGVSGEGWEEGGRCDGGSGWKEGTHGWMGEENAGVISM